MDTGLLVRLVADAIVLAGLLAACVFIGSMFLGPSFEKKGDVLATSLPRQTRLQSSNSKADATD